MAEAVREGRDPAVARHPAEPAGRRDVRILAALVGASALVYAVSSLLRLRDFRAGTYDLVIFDQALRSYSRFGAPVAMVKGVHNGFGPDFSVLGDHFSPILAVLAPLYLVHDGPRTLLVAQAVLFALAIVPIWRYAARRLGRPSAYLFAGAYALSWPIAEAVAFDFHEVAFVPLLSALLVERYDAGRRGQAALAAFALLLVKEDMGLLLAGFGLVLLTRAGERRAGLAYLACGTAATWAASRVLITLFGGDNDYYWAYGSLGEDMPDAVLYVLTHPWAVPDALSSPPVKLLTMALLVLPLALLPLRSPLVLAAVPPLAERMMADRFGNWWEPRYHYSAFLIAILVMAAADGAYRLPGIPRLRLPRRHLPAAAALAATVAALPFFAFADLADPGLYRRDARDRAAATAVARVPDGALVETSNNLGPALSARARVLLWDREPRHAPWVVADTGRRTFPFRSVEEQRQRVGALIDAGYRTVFDAAGYVVLTRETPGRG
ncbi:hypothetical protein Acsp03_27740 [Actinomadura sp. NBRC 104412]|uniref:DUF2079 domain-containing protein n=1 Tax=Actinomadura sp. NBRC 104412 TaxID=3032203 RepID=UPI0024A38398|nr:DUF2079 domain-containing protein [Actinomadura sp. NBRC 104412]GLZ05308.1 hypothetical protein Acsp03_27740 [Actinomadura sp. NBRC 104412]